MWSTTTALRGHGLATQERQHLTGDVAGISVGRKEHVSRCYFFGLRRTLHWRLLSVLRNFLRFLVSYVERRPDWAGRDAVHANAPFDKHLRKRLGKSVDRSFGRRVIQELLVPFEAGFRPGIDDYASLGKVLERGLRHAEIAINVGLERVVPLLV